MHQYPYAVIYRINNEVWRLWADYRCRRRAGLATRLVEQCFPVATAKLVTREELDRDPTWRD